MNTTSKLSSSRIARLALSGLAMLALGSTVRPALALVDPDDDTVQFTMYEDAKCSGDTASGYLPGSGYIQIADLKTIKFNDMASSWSVCNSHSTAVVVTVNLYTDANYQGTSILAANAVTIPGGTCIAQNHITPNDAVSSVKVHVTQ